MDTQSGVAELAHCMLCPRECGANRLHGQRGACGVPGQLLAARASLHMWEEPCLSGSRGSGTVFFSGCGLGCVYCQNYSISLEGQGVTMGVQDLADTFLKLQEQGAHNINLVTAVQYLPQVILALERVKGQSLRIPVVYNSSGYERVESLRRLEGLVDIYLPDFKYMDAERARRYSHATDYPEVAKQALAEMVRQVPETRWDAQGMMQSGIIVRHLLLPGGREDSMAVVRYLFTTYGHRIYMSLMNQYTPVYQGTEYPELRRRIRRREYERIVEYAISMGVENAYIQEGAVARESFIPVFDGTGLIRKGEGSC